MGPGEGQSSSALLPETRHKPVAGESLPPIKTRALYQKISNSVGPSVVNHTDFNVLGVDEYYYSAGCSLGFVRLRVLNPY